MGLLPAALLAELEKATSWILPALEIELADGTTLRLTTAGLPFASASLGAYEPRVLKWGAFWRRVSEREGGLEAPTMEITLDDVDLWFAAYAWQLRGATATVKLLSPNVTAASYFTLGRLVVAGYKQEGTSWVLGLRMDDAWLGSESSDYGQFPKAALVKGEWPNLHQSAVGKPVPIIYGTHSAAGMGDQGMVPAYYVDTSGNRWAVAGHWCKAVPRVYLANDANGQVPTLQTLTTNYTLTYPVVAGRQYTCISWVGSPGTNPSVTCDVDGIETVGDGTGTLITNAVQQLQHLLHNWIYGDYRRGAWTTTAPLAASYFTAAAAFCSDFGLVGARWLEDQARSGQAEVSQFSHDLECMNLWTNAGELALAFFDHRLQNATVYAADRVVESRDVIGGDIGYQFDDEALVGRILTRWAPRAVGGEFLQVREDRDPSSSVNSIQATKEALWLPAASGQANIARDAASRRINRWRSLLPTITARLNLAFVDKELGTLLALTWARGLSEDGTSGYGDAVWRRRLLMLTGAGVDLDSMEVVAELQDIQPALTTFAAGFKSYKNGAGMEDGTFYLSPGNWVTCVRASTKHVDDPTGNLVTPLGSNVIPLAADGLLSEEASTNDLLYSALDSSWLSAWTSVPNGGTIAADTTRTLIDGTAQSIKVTAPAGGSGSMSGNELILQTTPTTYAGSTRISVSIDHMDTTGHQVSLYVRRTVDNWYWNENDRVFQAAAFANKLPLSGAATWIRGDLRNINVGTNPTAIQVFAGIEQATAVGSQSHNLAFVQCEAKRWPTSRIVTTSAVVTRAADTVKVVNEGPSGHYVWPLSQGTILADIPVPAWDADDLATGSTPYLLSLEFDASNKLEVRYSKDNARLEFIVTAAGVAYTAFSDAWYPTVASTIAVRWTSSNLELGKAQGTASVFALGGGAGTDAVYTTPPGFASAKSVYIGCKTGTPGTLQWGGALANVRIMPICLTDAALNALTTIPD